MTMCIAAFFAGTSFAASLKQDTEFRAIMDNFLSKEVPSKTPLVSEREAQLIAIVSLTVQQSALLLKEGVETALSKGVSGEEILEAVYQCAPYSGFPRTVESIEIVRHVFQEKNVKVKEKRATVNANTRLEKGADAQGFIFGQKYRDDAKNGSNSMTPVNYFLASNCFGDYYTRNGLDLKTRELLTMAMLVNLGTELQLKAHIQGNINIGRTSAFLEQAILCCLPYCGYPRTLNALRLLAEVSN